MGVNLLCKSFGRVKAHLFLAVVHGCHFNDNGQISARLNRNCDGRYLYIQQRGIVFLQPQPVIDTVIPPLFQVHDQINFLALFDGGDAKHVPHINNADSAHLHIVSDQFRR